MSRKTFPFPGKLALASEEARREAESEQQNYRSVVLDHVAKLKVAYYEWLTANKAIELTRKNSDLLSRFEEIARNRYTVGKGLAAGCSQSATRSLHSSATA